MRAVRRIFILFWKRWPFSSLVCQYIYEEKKIAFIAMPDPARVGETGNGQSGKREAHTVTDSDRGLLCSSIRESGARVSGSLRLSAFTFAIHVSRGRADSCPGRIARL